MKYFARRVGATWTLVAVAATVTFSGLPVMADGSPQARATNRNELWKRSVDLVEEGDFKQAADAVRKLGEGSAVTDQVRAWLDEYSAKQTARRAADKKEFDLYVLYAKQRVERKEYDDALVWARFAADVAVDRDEFLAAEWITGLTRDSLTKSSKFRADSKWRKAWQLYAQLGMLFDREPRYRKLERELGTLVRLESMFNKKNREKRTWEERLDKVRWEDAEDAFKLIAKWYVKKPNFKEIAEAGLVQMLLLAESEAAREAFEGLKNEDDRLEFEARVQARLDQVRDAPSIDRRAAVEHFRRVVKDINNETVRIPKEVIIAELIRGAFDPLDDFTTVIWPQATDQFDKHTRGDFTGVGISIIKNRDDEIEVITPLEGAPAYFAGVQAGDVITDVDGVSIKGYSTNKVVRTITGPKNTPVTLTIRRGKESLLFDLIREKVKIESVKGTKRDRAHGERWDYWLDKDAGIGYIRLSSFQKNTHEDLTNAMSALVGGHIKGLVLDLRGNPGGLLNSAWQISSLFLKRGETVVTTKGRTRGQDQSFSAPSDGPYCDLPLTVLVDESSASASEIVSGAIRDNGRGTIVGARTFGKFSVQNLIPLGPMSKAKLKITTAKYYLPGGDSAHREPDSVKWGVDPDVMVRLARFERFNIWKMRRENDLLGPPKPEEEEDDNEADNDDEVADANAEDDDKAETLEDNDAVADADADDDEQKLPKLDQPDENERPKEDPQLDAALLMMRVRLLGESNPKLVLADAAVEKEHTAKP